MLQRVGIRELRRRSRYYLARVVAGEHFEVTVFGRPVADLGPVDPRLSSFDGLLDLETDDDSEPAAPVTMRISAAKTDPREMGVIRVRRD
jgi:prevent-host-death family protein